MNIVLIGQSNFGAEVLNKIKENYKVSGVFGPNSNLDPIELACIESDIKFFKFKKLRSKEAINKFQDLMPDLCIMAYVTDIVPQEMISYPKLGTIQYHPSLLPKNRGPSSINWAIINGEDETGISIFWPDKGLDTGPILMQKKVKISEEDSVGSLYFNKLFPMGIEAILESIKKIKDGVAPKINQNEKFSSYEGWCKETDTKINWNSSYKKIHNLIRGADPQPGAHTIFKSNKIFLYGSQLFCSNHKNKYGSILDITKDGITIACKDGEVKINKIRDNNGKKISAFEWSIIVKLKIGDIFNEKE